MVKIRINNGEYEVMDNITILEACHSLKIKIPTLCYMKGINEEASCRMCVVELVGKNNLVPSCTTKVMEGMEILTHSLKVIEARKTTLELILSSHNKDCLNCEKSGSCELQNLASIYEVSTHKYSNLMEKSDIDNNNPCIVRDNSKCILCNRCVNFCNNIQGVSAIERNQRGLKTHIGSAFNVTLDKTKCVLCGGCVNVCPTGALMEKTNLEYLEYALNSKDLHVIAAYAPSVRVAVGEAFDYQLGNNLTGKLNKALKLMGFNKVFDISYGADLTVIEEANEFIERLNNKKDLPLLTSCCPAWVNYIKKHQKKYLPNLSSCKSPQQMFGAVCKTYYAKLMGINPKNIFVVSIMPCIAKKEEISSRDNATKYPDIDCVITTKELIKLIKKHGLNLKDLDSSDFDEPMGKGYSVIFGSSGGVMETALRYAKEKIEHKNYNKLEFKEIRGMSGIKEAEYEIGNEKIKVLVVSGLMNANKVLNSPLINNYQFIEVMACPGGCINGAGQPYINGYERSFNDYRTKRSKGLYSIENSYKTNKAKDNLYIKKLYKDLLIEPNSEKAHDVLHTKY